MGFYNLKKSVKSTFYRFTKSISPGIGLSRYFPSGKKWIEWLSFPPRVPKGRKAQIVVKNASFELYVSEKDSHVGPQIYADRVWEKAVSELFASVLHEGMTVIDLGAHIGYYSVLAGMRVRPHGRVYAFEPNRLSFDILVKNIELNGLQDIVVPFHKAAGNENAVKTLYGDSKNDPSDSFLSKTGDHKIQQTVDCVRVEDCLRGHDPELFDRPCVIKIDIEGFEVEACKGMEGLLRKSGVKLFTELNYERLRAAGSSAGAYLKLLQSFGFKIYVINHHAREEKDLLMAMSIGELVKKEGPDVHEDLYCVKT